LRNNNRIGDHLVMVPGNHQFSAHTDVDHTPLIITYVRTSVHE
jgi:hypothetical protein